MRQCAPVSSDAAASPDGLIPEPPRSWALVAVALVVVAAGGWVLWLIGLWLLSLLLWLCLPLLILGNVDKRPQVAFGPSGATFKRMWNRSVEVPYRSLMSVSEIVDITGGNRIGRLAIVPDRVYRRITRWYAVRGAGSRAFDVRTDLGTFMVRDPSPDQTIERARELAEAAVRHGHSRDDQIDE
jgi:hypothetical protein